MTDTSDSRRILDLLAQGKITVDQADQLLRAIGANPSASSPSLAADSLQSAPRGSESKPSPKWLCMTIDKGVGGGGPRRKVNIRVPISVFRSGMKISAVLPQVASDAVVHRLRERGIDLQELSKLALPEFENVLGNLGETTIDIDDGRAQVRFSTE